MILYQFPVSPFCDKIRRILDFKGVAYRTEPVPLMKTLGAYKRVNPTGKVPCIEHRGKRIGDSTAIAHYLETEFPEPRLVPVDPKERGLCHLLEDWADESLYFYQKRLKFTFGDARTWTEKFSAYDSGSGKAVLAAFLPRRQRRQLHEQGVGRKSAEAVIEDVERHVASVESLLGRGTWLVGESLSLADIAVFAQLSALEASPEGHAIVERHPPVRAWLHRVDGRTRAQARHRT